MQEMLKQALNCDYEEDLLILAKAAKIVRRDIFNFNGSNLILIPLWMPAELRTHHFQVPFDHDAGWSWPAGSEL